MCVYVSVLIAIDMEYQLGLCVSIGAYSYRYGIPTWTVCFYVSVHIAVVIEYQLGMCVFSASVLIAIDLEYQLGQCVFMCRCL